MHTYIDTYTLLKIIPRRFAGGQEENSRDGHFFGNRVINAWNSLSDYIVTSPTVACFKSRIVKLKFLL